MSPMFVAVLIGASSVAIIGFAISGSRPRVSRETENVIAEYGVLLRVVSIGVTTILASLTILVSFQQPDALDVIVFLAVFTFLIGGYLVLDTHRTRIEFGKEKFLVRPALQHERTYLWADVSCLEYSSSWMWYVITTNDGRKFRVHDWLTGGDVFVDFARRWSKFNKSHKGS
jgi:hypothetical protein